ncbi:MULTISPECIES: hypothetical protein [Polymorphospora]|uniref:Uncharacterized protein n=1 Tax=Polymorphospora lycopeni TaxID=3140240 RepID=A0ABV5D2M2_9ACTN
MGEPVGAVELMHRVIGRDLVAVTEARHWHDGRRGGDAESLLHFWLHFQEVPPLMAHGCGELLLLEFSAPYAAYDMGEYGETRVGPAQKPDLLALLPGHRLLDAALVRGYATRPALGGVLLRFDHCDLVVASFGDEWVLRQETIPPELATCLTVGTWLGDRAIG